MATLRRVLQVPWRAFQYVSNALAITATVISGIVIVVTMVAIGVDILLRNVRGAPLGGVVEFSEVGLVVLAFFAIGAAQRTDSHIAVTSVFARLPKVGQQVAHVVVTLVGVLVCAVLFWASLRMAITSVQTGEFRLGAARAPMWPARSAVAAGFLVWGALLLAQIGRLPEPDVTESDVGL